MNRLEIQRALYDARDGYAKAQQQVKFYQNEISFLKECERELTLNLYDEMFGDTPLFDEVYGG